MMTGRSPQERVFCVMTTVALAVWGCAHPSAPPAMTDVPPRVGIALGGGGARGFAEIGVLRVLEQERIPVTAVAGTSVGALVGALYADTGRVLDAEFHAVALHEADVFDYALSSVLSGGLIKGDALEEFLRTRLRNQTIESMALPFAAVAVDLRTGQPVIFTQGPVAPAVHASAAIPGVFVPVTIDGKAYVDGGVVDPVPVDAARKLGAEVVIAVVIPPDIPRETPTNPLVIAYRAVTIMASLIGDLRAREADVVIRPEVGEVAFDDFSQKKGLIESGEAAARAALPEIRRVIRERTRYEPAHSPVAGPSGEKWPRSAGPSL
jgi:NTE family protein